MSSSNRDNDKAPPMEELEFQMNASTASLVSLLSLDFSVGTSVVSIPEEQRRKQQDQQEQKRAQRRRRRSARFENGEQQNAAITRTRSLEVPSSTAALAIAAAAQRWQSSSTHSSSLGKGNGNRIWQSSRTGSHTRRSQNTRRNSIDSCQTTLTPPRRKRSDPRLLLLEEEGEEEAANSNNHNTSSVLTPPQRKRSDPRLQVLERNAASTSIKTSASSIDQSLALPVRKRSNPSLLLDNETNDDMATAQWKSSETKIGASCPPILSSSLPNEKKLVVSKHNNSASQTLTAFLGASMDFTLTAPRRKPSDPNIFLPVQDIPSDSIACSFHHDGSNSSYSNNSYSLTMDSSNSSPQLGSSSSGSNDEQQEQQQCRQDEMFRRFCRSEGCMIHVPKEFPPLVLQDKDRKENHKDAYEKDHGLTVFSTVSMASVSRRLCNTAIQAAAATPQEALPPCPRRKQSWQDEEFQEALLILKHELPQSLPSPKKSYLVGSHKSGLPMDIHNS